MAAAAAASLASCTAQALKTNLKSDVDSLSYSIGISQTQGLKDYLSQSSGDGYNIYGRLHQRFE